MGAGAGEAVLFASGADGRSRLGEPNRELDGEVTPIVVRIVTLDEHCRTARIQPDWLLIDIEGFEIAALEGASATIRSRGRDLGIVVTGTSGVLTPTAELTWPQGNVKSGAF